MRLFTLICAFALSFNAYSQVILSENFEPRPGYVGGGIPTGWTYDYETWRNVNWSFIKGGHLSNPDTAASGNFNAMFQRESFDNDRTKLVSPPIDLSNTYTPRLTFQHVQKVWYWQGAYNNDELRVFYKTSPNGHWKLLRAYTAPLEKWTEQEIYLNPADVSSTYYLAFEGKTGYGHGTCIDNIVVEEMAAVDKHVTNFAVQQASADFVATNTNNNPILRIPIRVQGNTNTLQLESLKVKSLNTSDTDIKPLGVKLWITQTGAFSNPQQIAPAVNFVAGTAQFAPTIGDIPYGYQYFWVTYDIAANASPGHKFDAMVQAGSAVFSNSVFPAADVSPDGYRTILETVYFQDFDADYSDWILSPHFTVGEPSGKGGTEGGNPDPSFAVSQPNVLGNGAGAATDEGALYPNSLTDTVAYAISPVMDLSYYVNTILRFDQWLNVEGWDAASILISTDGKQTWQPLWANNNVYYNESSWNTRQIDISQLADRKKEVAFRFSLGPTSPNVRYTGWNIDNFVTVASFLNVDMAVTAWHGPFTGCGLGDNRLVSVTVRNLAGKPSQPNIPIGYSLNGGATYIMDTIRAPLAIGDSIVFVFSEPAQLSIPGIYKPVARVFAAGDEFPANDIFIAPDIRSIPVYSMPYFADFEAGTDFWLPTGINSTWALGRPNANEIKSAYSGRNSWATSLNSTFSHSDSSMLTSPCFDFSGTDDPVFQFAYNSQIDPNVAGAGLQYSLDTGKTWLAVPKLGDVWNWQPDANSAALQSKFNISTGWASNSGGWKIAKHYLPKDLKENSTVRFRVVFASLDQGFLTDGFAFDAVELYNAPPDVGVLSIDTPVSQCELSDEQEVSVTIKNYGIAAIKTGQLVVAGLDLDGHKQCLDSFYLAANLAPGATFSHTFSCKPNMFDEGDYNLTAFTRMPLDTDFYDETTNNDTARLTVTVLGMPNYSLGPDFGVEDTTNVLLDAGQGFVSYLWTGGSTARTLQLPNQGTFHVTVTNSQGCQASSSVTVIFSAKDVFVSSLAGPLNQCVISGPQELSVYVYNNHNHTFAAADQITLAYKLGNNPRVQENLILDSEFAKGDSLFFTFASKINLDAAGDYKLSVYTVIPDDINLQNDTLHTTISHYGLPVVDFGADTIYTMQADTLVLSPKGMFSHYAWSDGTDLPQLQVNRINSQLYSLDVTSAHSCGNASGSVFVSAADIGIGSIMSPITGCGLSQEEPIEFIATNLGRDTLHAGSPIYLSVYSGTVLLLQDTVLLAHELLPLASGFFSPSKTIDLSEIGEHELLFSISIDGDMVKNNNSTSVVLESKALPELSISKDTIYYESGPLPYIHSGYSSPTAQYLWSTYDTLAGMQVSHGGNMSYAVTVTDNGCTSVGQVRLISDNFGIDPHSANVSVCELGSTEQIKVRVTNYSVNRYLVNTKLVLSYQINDGPVVQEDFLLPIRLDERKSIDYTFMQLADFSQHPSYTITYSVYYPTDKFSGNNTLTGTVEIAGYPEPDFGFGKLIETRRPDTVSLWLDRQYDYYQWHDGGSHKDVLFVTGKNPQWYKVTVGWEPGCYGSDSVFIQTYDIALSEIVSPASSCTPDSNATVTVAAKNMFSSEIPAGDKLVFSYLFGGSIYKDTVVLASPLAQGDIYLHTFSDTLALAAGEAYELKAWIDYGRDVRGINNDSLAVNFSVHGNPLVDIGYDTIYTTKPDTLSFSAGQSFLYYNWNTGSTSFELYPDYQYSHTYAVTVTDYNLCKAADSVFVFTQDIGVAEIISPADTCLLPEAAGIVFVIENYSANYIAAGMAANAMLVSGSDTLAEAVINIPAMEPYSRDTVSLPGSINLSQYEQIDIMLIIYGFADADTSNNYLLKTISQFGDPVVKLNADSLYLGVEEEFEITIGGIFQSYLWSSGSAEAAATVSGAEPGYIYVTVTDSYGCKGSAAALVVSRDAGLMWDKNYSACHLRREIELGVWIKNHGGDIIEITDEIILSVTINGAETASETVAYQILPSDSVLHVFTEPLVIAANTDFELAINISLDKDVNPLNDSIAQTVKAYGYPELVLSADTLFTVTPIGTMLSTVSEHSAYTWGGSAEGREHEIMSAASRWYHVQVANQYGCLASDSIFVFTRDIAITGLLSPADACEWGADEAVSIQLENTGAELISHGSIISVTAYADGQLFSQKDLEIETDWLPGQMLAAEFAEKLQAVPGISEVSLQFDIAAFRDAEPSNNSFAINIGQRGYPAISFGQNFLQSSLPDTINYVFPANYSYVWASGSVANSESMGGKAANTFSVTATDELGCRATDSVTVIGLSISGARLSGIGSSCLLETEDISAGINISTTASLSPADSVFAQLRVNNAETALLYMAESMQGGGNWDFSIQDFYDFSNTGVYEIKIVSGMIFKGVKYEMDSAEIVVHNYGYPDADIGIDTLRERLPYTFDMPSLYSYKWNGAAAPSSYTVSNSGWHTMVASNEKACTVTDSVFVIGYDVSLDSIVLTKGNWICTAEMAGKPLYKISNAGPDIIPAGAELVLTINSKPDTLYLAQDLEPYSSILHKSSVQIPVLLGPATVNASLFFAGDIFQGNNSKQLLFDIYRSPSFRLFGGFDTVKGQAPFYIEGPNGYTYSWSNGENTKTIAANTQGNYRLTIIDDMGCTASDSVYLVLEGGTNAVAANGGAIKIAPTVFNSGFGIEAEDAAQAYKLRIVSAAGHTVYKGSLAAGSSKLWIGSQDWLSGVYVLEISTLQGQQIISTGLVKE
jgi:hypothetical protein